MRRRLIAAAFYAALPFFLPGRVAAVDQPAAPVGVVACAECGMSVKIANRYTARMVQGGSTRYFCDIGDLAVFIERTRPKQHAASVRDFTSGEWIEVDQATFVVDKKTFSTPMGWGVAAFRDGERVSGKPMDFEALRKALR